MNASIIAKIIRHLLTACGGVGIATDENVSQALGSLSFLVGLAWSIWESRQNKPSNPGPSIKLGVVLVCASILTACASIAPGNDPVVVRAEQTYKISNSTVHTLLSLEEKNRDAIWQLSPETAKVTDRLRVTYPTAARAFRAALGVYKSARNSESRSELLATEKVISDQAASASLNISEIQKLGLE